MNLAELRTRKDFGERFTAELKEWMEKNHKSQKDFCAAAGVSKNIVTDWKNGKRLPRDAQMMKICDVFGKDPRAFEPFFPMDKDYIDNSVSEEWSNQLQQYADEKGLDNNWYEYFTTRPNFLRYFPFSNLPAVQYDSGFDLVKYEFIDDAGNKIRLSREDIDFMVDLQKHSDTENDYLMYRKRLQIDRERIKRFVEICIKPYSGNISTKEVLKRLYAVDLTKKEQPITDKMIFDTIRNIANEKEIRPVFTREEIIQAFESNPLYDEDWVKSWKDWGRINGKEEEAESIIRQAMDSKRAATDEMIHTMKDAGLLEETEE